MKNKKWSTGISCTPIIFIILAVHKFLIYFFQNAKHLSPSLGSTSGNKIWFTK